MDVAWQHPSAVRLAESAPCTPSRVQNAAVLYLECHVDFEYTYRVRLGELSALSSLRLLYTFKSALKSGIAHFDYWFIYIVSQFVYWIRSPIRRKSVNETGACNFFFIRVASRSRPVAWCGDIYFCIFFCFLVFSVFLFPFTSIWFCEEVHRNV